ncbi:hypothetical protein FRC02_001154 [Tulasnella sp. 418]|nr:hypothetical protein FRC02_001154 [Tulasnella sp. 418]
MFSSPLAKFFTTAYEQTVSTTNAAAAALTPASYATPVGSTTPSPPASEFPMQGALKALLYLRRLNAELVDDGWTLASDKGGLSVTKKMEPSISDTIHVHKAEKVIEGISAGEIALAISNYDSRKAWDDRFSSYTELESYGSGCSTGFLVVKSGFPFRDRGFWVSSIACRLSNASPPLQVSRGRRLGSDASLTAPSTVSDSSAIFIVSVSYNPSAAPSRFSSSKVNPAVFPTGQLLISGWILETVDPYQPDQNYAIPSTKCVHVVAVDYRGSVPIAFNSSMNAMLPRTEILGLEAWLKSKGAFNVGPGVRTPGQSLAIGPEDPPATEDSNSREAWTLRKEEDAVLLSISFDPLSKEFRTKVSLSLSPSETAFSDTEETSPTASPESRSLVEIPARMFTRSFSRSSTMPYGQPNAFRREQSSSDASVASSSTFTPRRFSSTAPRLYTNGSAASPVQRSASRRLSSSTFLPSAEGPPDAGNEGDLIVSELIVNPVLYRVGGYRIDISVLSRELGGKEVVDLAALNQLLQEAVDSPLYPFVAQVYTTPASPLLSTTLDKPISRHLVRITLPVRQYYAPTITDPLTGEVRKPPAKPDWLKAVEADGIVVAIKLTEVASAAPPREDAVDCKVWLKGNELKVTSEKTSIMVLGREVLEDEKLWSLAFLSRSAAKDDDEVLPSSLREPVAVNKALLEDPPLKKDPEPSPPTATPADSSLQKDETPTPTPIPPEVVIPDASAVTTQSSQGNGFFNLWNASANFLRIPTLPVVTRPTTPHVLKDEPKQDDILQSAPETVVTAETTTTPKDVVAGVSLDVLNSPRRYRLSTLIIVAVIAFLCGSLLRSLLSPADFIYFTPESDGSVVAGHTSKDGSSGWREVRRLFEIKYGLVGWDFVVAVVRRPTE